MHSVEILPDVAEHVAALPAKALTVFAEVNVMLELTPWNGDPLNRSTLRSVTFGPSAEGLIFT